jgi:RNA polymerase sigma-70 factor (ECF subfamily)
VPQLLALRRQLQRDRRPPRYHLFHATRAELLRTLGRAAEAREADVRAVALTSNPAERALLQERAGLH